MCIRSAGSPDAPGVDRALSALAELEGISRDAFEARMAERTLLKHMPRLHEIANLAVLAASDLASSMTGVIAKAPAARRPTDGSLVRRREVHAGWFSREEDPTLIPGWQLSFADDRPS